MSDDDPKIVTIFIGQQQRRFRLHGAHAWVAVDEQPTPVTAPKDKSITGYDRRGQVVRRVARSSR